MRVPLLYVFHRGLTIYMIGLLVGIFNVAACASSAGEQPLTRSQFIHLLTYEGNHHQKDNNAQDQRETSSMTTTQVWEDDDDSAKVILGNFPPVSSDLKSSIPFHISTYASGLPETTTPPPEA